MQRLLNQVPINNINHCPATLAQLFLIDPWFVVCSWFHFPWILAQLLSRHYLLLILKALNKTYENFLRQVKIAEQLTSSDFGVSIGLISQGYWEASKWYFVNVEHGNIADKLQPRNINVSFTNNSNVALDLIIFTFYSDQLGIHVETDMVSKKVFYNIVMIT